MDKILKKCNTSTSDNNSSIAVFKITGETGTNWIDLYLILLAIFFMKKYKY